MALKLEVEERAPRRQPQQADNNSIDIAPEIASESESDVLIDAADTMEEITFPKPRQRSFLLLPAVMDFSERPDFSSFPRRRTAVEIIATRFTRRIVALQRVLEAPETHAERLARALHKIRKSGELKPVVAPASVPSGLPPEIGILHGEISFELRQALKRWDSS